MLRKMLASPWLYYTGAILLAIVAVASQFRLNIPTRPQGEVADIRALADRDDLNVIFILVDTLRADRLSAYGYQRPTSPNLEQLAIGGVRFAHVDAQSSWTKCSMASLWTGMFPQRIGVLRMSDSLPEKAPVPAEIFQNAGYRTAGIWRNGWIASNFGFDRGFETYIRPVARADAPQVERRSPGRIKLNGTDQDITLSAIEFLNTHGREKFFLYLHYMDVHQYVYDDAAAALDFGPSLSDAYDLSIHWTDRNLGTLFQELENRKLMEKTIVVVASDHGEAFYEHGFEGHARDLYREVVEVPLIVSLPFRLKVPIVVDSLVRNVDIWPTIYDLVGLEIPEHSDGVSLVPVMEASARGETPETPPSFGYLDQTWGKHENEESPLISMQQGRRRVIFNATEPEESLRIYDHEADPKEARNLVSQAPEWAEPMLEELSGSLEWERPHGDVESISLDAMMREQLKALGYVIK